MDQQMLWDVLDPVGDDFEDYLLAPDLADLYADDTDDTDQGNAMSVEDFLSGSGVQYANATTQGSASMNMWESGAPSSSEHPHSEGTREGTKIESMCPTSLTYNRGGPLRIGVRRSEAVQSSNSNDLPRNFDPNSGNLGTSSHAQEAVYHPQYNTTSLEPGLTSHSGGSSVTRGSSSRDIGIYSENSDDRRGLSLDGHRACKRKHTEGVPVQGSTSGSSSLFSQSENNTLHSVSHHNPSNNANISGPSDFPSGSTPVTQLNLRVGTSTGVVASDFSSANLPGNLEGSQRSIRMRINPTHQHNTPVPVQWAQGNTTDSNVWSANRSPLPTPSLSVGFRPVCTGASSQSAVSAPIIHRLPRRASSRRVGSSPNNPIIVSERSTGATVASGGVNSSSIARTSSLEISGLAPAHYIRQLPLPQRSARSVALGEVSTSSILGVNSSDTPALSPPHLSRRQSLPQISANLPQSVSSPHVNHPQMLGLANGSTSINESFVAAPHNRQPLPLFLGLPNRGASIPEATVPAPRASMHSGVHQSQGVHQTRVQVVGAHQSQPTPRIGSTSGVDQLLGPTIAPHNFPNRYARNTPGAIRRSLFTSGAAAAYLAANAAPQPVRSATSQDLGRTPGVGLHGHPMAQVRSSLARQRDGGPGIPVSVQGLTAVAAGRSRMISEQIRNMLDQMRRGENVRLEDMFLFDHSIFHGGADLLDRHRDMRLDVDRMSYEELLALEERIGNVSTGLTEEIVMKCLNQRTYKSGKVEASEEVEPCCICQEEYVGGDDLGILDCGHDFHVVCVKQWLMQKNVCPICKTTGLKSAEK